MATMLSRELEQSLYLKRLSNYAGEWGTARLVNMMAQALDSISENPEHPLRFRYSALLQRWIVRLQNDARARREQILMQRCLRTNPTLPAQRNTIRDERSDW